MVSYEVGFPFIGLVCCETVEEQLSGSFRTYGTFTLHWVLGPCKLHYWHFHCYLVNDCRREILVIRGAFIEPLNTNLL